MTVVSLSLTCCCSSLTFSNGSDSLIACISDSFEALLIVWIAFSLIRAFEPLRPDLTGVVDPPRPLILTVAVAEPLQPVLTVPLPVIVDPLWPAGLTVIVNRPDGLTVPLDPLEPADVDRAAEASVACVLLEPAVVGRAEDACEACEDACEDGCVACVLLEPLVKAVTLGTDVVDRGAKQVDRGARRSEANVSW